MALPFFRNGLVGDLSSTLVLFAADFAVRRLVAEGSREPVAAEPVAVRAR
jgi:hypothetical protein